MGKPDDERDIPDQAAKYSLNIDPISEGELTGIPDEQYLKPTGFANDFTSWAYDQGNASMGTSQTTQASNKNINPPAQ